MYSLLFYIVKIAKPFIKKKLCCVVALLLLVFHYLFLILEIEILHLLLDGNKRRYQLRKKIAVEKIALEDAITEHNATVREADKLPSPNKFLAEDNHSWPWECKYTHLKTLNSNLLMHTPSYRCKIIDNSLM